MYLLVKNIPAQKLPTQRKIIHFWDITLLGSRSPLLFQVIVLYNFFKPIFQVCTQKANTMFKIMSQIEETWEEAINGAGKEENLKLGTFGKKKKIWGGQRNRERNKNREVLCFFLLCLILSLSSATLCYALLCVIVLFFLSLFGMCECVSLCR